MNNKEKIMNLIFKNNGILKSSDLLKLGISTKYLTNMVKEGIIEKTARGVYADVNTFDDDFFNIQISSKYAIFSNTTALYLHGLSNRTPISYDITVPYNYSGSLMNNKRVNLFRVNKNILELGAIMIKSPQGANIKVYDVERTICDVLKNKKKIDNDIILNAIKLYINNSNKDIYKLNKYAKILKIEKEVNRYLEVLL
jgi:predicted transcriptional regulator of viral defense system